MARLFSRRSDTAALRLLHTFEQSESRLKASELADDRSGHGSSDRRAGGESFEPRVSPRRKEHLQFARTLAQRLDEGLASGDCDRITVYASSPFIGELKEQLSLAAKKVLRVAVDVDLTSYGLRELEERIAHQLHTIKTRQHS